MDLSLHIGKTSEQQMDNYGFFVCAGNGFASKPTAI